MGGKALKVKTVRKNTEELYRIYGEISSVIHRELSIKTHIIKFYHNKETHGDLDILLKMDKHIPNLSEWVKFNFNPNHIYNNGGVISFDYDNFQIDLIPVKVSNWKVSKAFFDYDPTGNLMGKIAHALGFKYGFEGLIYPMRNFNGRLSENIVISKDNEKIFNFLGYDFNKYQRGFDTIEQLFKYIINGRYFSSKNYYMENLTSKGRKRNKKRKSYQDFIKYLSDNDIHKDFEFKPKNHYLKIANSYFPESNLFKKLKEFENKDLVNKQLSEKFNGHLIMTIIPELKGKELGSAMNNFKMEFEDFKDFVMNNSSEQIMQKFKNWYLKK